jgi:hypothetical protein
VKQSFLQFQSPQQSAQFNSGQVFEFHLKFEYGTRFLNISHGSVLPAYKRYNKSEPKIKETPGKK